MHCIRFGGSGANIARSMFGRVSLVRFIVMAWLQLLFIIGNDLKYAAQICMYVCNRWLLGNIHFLYVLWLLTFSPIDIFPLRATPEMNF